MKTKLILLLGILCFSTVIGIITGASNSPIAGGVISGVVGIGLALLSLITNKEAELKNKISTIGSSFIFISIGLLVGLYLGIEYRYTNHINMDERKFIWEGQQPPQTTYEALDWILVNELLINKGFNRNQVKSLYQIRIKEINDTTINNNFYSSEAYSKESPFYKMIIGGYQSNLLQRSIANVTHDDIANAVN